MARTKRDLKHYSRLTISGEDFLINSLDLLAERAGHRNRSAIVSDLIRKELKRIGYAKLMNIKNEREQKKADLEVYKDFLDKKQKGR